MDKTRFTLGMFVMFAGLVGLFLIMAMQPADTMYRITAKQTGKTWLVRSYKDLGQCVQFVDGTRQETVCGDHTVEEAK